MQRAMHQTAAAATRAAHNAMMTRACIMRNTAAMVAVRAAAPALRRFASTAAATPASTPADAAKAVPADVTATPAVDAAESVASAAVASESSSSSSGGRVPTDQELLSEKQRFFFRASDWILGGFLGLMVGKLLFFLAESPEVLDEVVRAAEEDELIAARVGSPASSSFFWSGNANEHNASLVVPIRGPKGSATLHARAFFDKHTEAWKLMLLQASFEGEGAQRHSITIPDRYIAKPRYVSPEEMERIKKKHEDMMKAMQEHHGQPKTEENKQ